MTFLAYPLLFAANLLLGNDLLFFIEIIIIYYLSEDHLHHWLIVQSYIILNYILMGTYCLDLALTMTAIILFCRIVESDENKEYRELILSIGIFYVLLVSQISIESGLFMTIVLWKML